MRPRLLRQRLEAVLRNDIIASLARWVFLVDLLVVDQYHALTPATQEQTPAEKRRRMKHLLTTTATVILGSLISVWNLQRCGTR